MELGLGDQG